MWASEFLKDSLGLFMSLCKDHHSSIWWASPIALLMICAIPHSPLLTFPPLGFGADLLKSLSQQGECEMVADCFHWDKHSTHILGMRVTPTDFSWNYFYPVGDNMTPGVWLPEGTQSVVLMIQESLKFLLVTMCHAQLSTLSQVDRNHNRDGMAVLNPPFTPTMLRP